MALNIFKDYLTQCTHAVKIDTVMSEDEEIKIGFPQGSILGPTLLVVYINDLYKMKLRK